MNLTVGILNVGDVFTRNIQSFEYEEEEGTPSKGYRLEYGGEGLGDGQIKSVGGLFKDMRVRGNMDLRNADGSSGANILHPALTTVEGMPGDSTGKTLDAATKWRFKDMLYDKIQTENAFLSATEGDEDSEYNGNKILSVLKLTDVDDEAYSSETGSSVELGNGDNTFIVFNPSHAGRVTVTGTAPKRLQQIYDNEWRSCALTFKQGSTVLATVASKSIRGGGTLDSSFSVSFDISSGGNILCVVSHVSGIESTVNGHCTGTLSAQTFAQAGFTRLGLWMRHYQGSSHPTVWYFHDLYELHSASTESFEIYVEGHWRTSYANLAVMSMFTGYTSYTWTDGDDVTHTESVDIGKTYRLDPDLSNVVYEGIALTTRKATYFRRDSATVATLFFSDGTSVSFSGTDYLYMYGRIAISSSENGIEMMGQYPKEDGVYDMGTPEKYWRAAYVMDIPGMSKRSEKKDVELYERSALDIIRNTRIVRFKFIRDKKGTPHIGFIAEETDSDLSGKDQDSFMRDNIQGVCMKAIQELAFELDRLKGGNQT